MVKLVATVGADGSYSVYADTGQDSMADERLLVYGLTLEEVTALGARIAGPEGP